MVLFLIAIASFIGMHKANPNSAPLPLHIEFDAGVLAVSGKNNTQNFNTNLDSQYDFGHNTLKVFGDYLKSSTESVDSALHWTAGARYENEFIPASRLYLEYYSEADPFIGYVQRNNEGLGYQYAIHKDSTVLWWAELGYLHSSTNIIRQDSVYESKARFASGASWRFDKFWYLEGKLEYLFNLSFVNEDLMNYEFALTSLINSTLALRTAYLMRFMETPYQGSRYQGTTTLSLVATF
jgi:putative salt-induced outer membrane protein YdiY